MKNLKNWAALLAVLAAMSSVQGAFGQSQQATPNSAESSRNSAIHAEAGDEIAGADITAACSAAVNELGRSRLLADLLERENSLLRERLDTEQEHAGMLRDLAETRKAEAEALRAALAAKNETIAAKDAVIAGQDRLAAQLKKKKVSPLKQIGGLLAGIAIMAILK